MKHIVVKIDWFGPFKSIEAAQGAAKVDFKDGLYLAIGALENRSRNKIRYVGLSSNLGSRVSAKHSALAKLEGDYELWLGEVASTAIPGKKTQSTDLLLDMAEWSHVYFIDPALNDKKTFSPPKYPTTIVNHWWDTTYDTLLKKRPHKDWPDIIDYLGKDYGAKVVWYDGRCEKWKPKHF